MYRILSPTAILGYGFPRASFEQALELDLNLIAVDAGSMDAGPYYLGSRSQYVGMAALRRDLQMMVQGALQKGCPLIVGSAGFAGEDRQLKVTADLVKELVSAEVQRTGVAADRLLMAVIPSEVPGGLLRDAIPTLTPLGDMPPLTSTDIDRSVIVGQMGIEPIAAALELGARIIVCGRAYDPAIFSADAIRKGYPPGVCLHAAKILECGAIASEPGSGSDCLVAELTLEGTATFYPCNPKRRATVKSVAAHTLYEKSRPDLFHLPGGILSIQNTTFAQTSKTSASLQGSAFVRGQDSIKLEGSRSLGHRIVSVLPLLNTALAACAADMRVYGRNGVETTPADDKAPELGLVVVVRAADRHTAKDALAFLRSTMLHYGYEGRISTAGNLAFPFSPSDMLLTNPDGTFTALFVAGSRDPVFQAQRTAIEAAGVQALKDQHPHLHEKMQVAFLVGDRRRPIGLLETIDADLATAKRKHQTAQDALQGLVDDTRPAFAGVEMGQAYVWSVHHLVKDPRILGQLFPLQLARLQGTVWEDEAVVPGPHAPLALAGDATPIDENANRIQDRTVTGHMALPLQDLARVIRSKNAGINEITFDILFTDEGVYRTAIASGLFGPAGIAATMGVALDQVLGSYRYDPACAIKFTLKRPLLCGSPGERDVFGAQQHTRLLTLQIPTA